jgi:hypothetical protein
MFPSSVLGVMRIGFILSVQNFSSRGEQKQPPLRRALRILVI